MRCNQREQLLNEVVLDLDEGSYADYLALIQRLKNDKIEFYAYATKAGRARHIHTLWPRLIGMPKWKREAVKLKILEKYGCDPAFKSDAHMVPLEWAAHWKTGEIKKLIDSSGGDYDPE